MSEVAEQFDDEDTEAVAEAAVVDTGEPEAVVDGTDRRLSAEAARHRTAARAAETKLAIAEARITELQKAADAKIAELQKAEVNRIFKDRFVSADDAWLLPDVSVQAMLTDDGKVDPDLVHEMADNILETRPHWRMRPQRIGAPASAVTGDGKAPGSGMPAQPGWAELLKGKTAG
jgi:hypothetical protein